MYHSEEIVYTVDWGWVFCYFLVETVAQVVSWVSRDYQCFFVLRKKSCQTTTGSGFTNTSFSSYKNPV
jgi:hypothetical protein